MKYKTTFGASTTLTVVTIVLVYGAFLLTRSLSIHKTTFEQNLNFRPDFSDKFY